MSKETGRLEKARERASNSLLELARAEAREKEREGVRDTKRKILLGAAVEVMMRTDANLRVRFESFMRGFLKRPADLAVFDLVDAEASYFDRVREAADAEVDAAVDALVDPRPAGLRLGATPSRPTASDHAGSKVPPPIPSVALTPSMNGTAQAAPSRPSLPPSSSTQS